MLEHGILIGTLSAFTTYAVSIFEPIQQMARVLANIIAVQPNIERVMGLLDQKPNIVDTPEVIEKYGDSFHPKTENWEISNLTMFLSGIRMERKRCSVTLA